MFLAILAALNGGLVAVVRATHVDIPSPTSVVFPIVGLGEVVTFGLLIAATLIMSKFEHRPFDVYGLPWRDALRSRLWLGLGSGFAAISLVMLLIFAFGGVEIAGMATTGIALLAATVIWAPIFLLVGLSEEFFSRGYAQFTLATGIGFWPAATLLSLAFGAMHLHNAGETPLGIGAAVVLALVLCLALRATGNLWLGVGIHAGWDWGESFFYGASDSGMMIWRPFLSSRFHGAPFVTGGVAGPEGSAFTLVVLAAMAAIILARYPTVRSAPGAKAAT